MKKLWDPYPKEHADYIHSNYIGVGPKEMTERLNQEFGTSYTRSQIKAYYGNHKLNSGVTGYFEKGIEPPNKGKKGVWDPRCEKTWFKKGTMAPNRKPIGSVRYSKEGYLVVKVRDFTGNRNWKEKHRIVWEEHNGPVPKDHCVIFLDGDKTNITIDNLALISRNENRILNQKSLRSDIPEVTEAYINLAKLQVAKQKLKKRKKTNKTECV